MVRSFENTPHTNVELRGEDSSRRIAENEVALQFGGNPGILLSIVDAPSPIWSGRKANSRKRLSLRIRDGPLRALIPIAAFIEVPGPGQPAGIPKGVKHRPHDVERVHLCPVGKLHIETFN